MIHHQRFPLRIHHLGIRKPFLESGRILLAGKREISRILFQIDFILFGNIFGIGEQSAQPLFQRQAGAPLRIPCLHFSSETAIKGKCVRVSLLRLFQLRFIDLQERFAVARIVGVAHEINRGLSAAPEFAELLAQNVAKVPEGILMQHPADVFIQITGQELHIVMEFPVGVGKFGRTVIAGCRQPGGGVQISAGRESLLLLNVVLNLVNQRFLHRGKPVLLQNNLLAFPVEPAFRLLHLQRCG